MPDTRKKAAEQERQGNIIEALFLWRDAALDADTLIERQWCKDRADFCQKQAERNLKGYW